MEGSVDYCYIQPFINYVGEQYRFYMHDFPEKERISKMIKWGYGILEQEPGGEYTIELASPDYEAGDKEVYAFQYIIACYAKRKMLNIKDFSYCHCGMKDKLKGEDKRLYPKCTDTETKYGLTLEDPYRAQFTITFPVSIIFDQDRVRKLTRRTADRLNKISKYNSDFDPMSVLEHRMSWTEAEKYRLVREPGVKKKSYATVSSAAENTVNEGTIVSIETGDHYKSDYKNLRKNVLQRNSERKRIGKFSRNSIQAEHKKIIECIIEYKAYNLLHGKDFWRMLGKEIWKNKINWRYLKQEFYEKILPDIESFKLTESEIAFFRSMRNRMCAAKSKSCLEEEKENEDEVTVLLETEEDEEEISRRNVYPLKQKQNEEEDEKSQIYRSSINYYREEEDRAILSFIKSGKERYKQTGGVKLWKLMERKKVVPGRSWQSMKERYRKFLINYLQSNKDDKLKETELSGGGVAKRRNNELIRTTPEKAVLKYRAKINHAPAIKCTCCFDLVADEADTESPINSEIAVSGSNKLQDSNNSKPVSYISNTGEHVRVTNKRSKRKLFTQSQSISEFTPISDDEKVICHSVKPHKLFSKKNGKVSDKKSKNFNNAKGKFIKKSNKNKMAADKDINPKLNNSNVITSSVETNNNLDSQRDIITKRRGKVQNEREINVQNRKCYGSCTDSKENCEISMSAKSKKATKQLAVCLVRCDELLHLKHSSTEAKGDRKQNATEDIHFVAPDTRITLTDTLTNNMISDSDLSLFSINEHMLLEISETQEILDEMLDGKEITGEIFQQNTIMNKENNTDDNQGNSDFAQSKEETLQSVSNSHCNQNMEDGKEVSLLDSDCTNILNDLEENIEKIADAVSNNSTENNCSSRIHKETLTKFNRNIKETDSIRLCIYSQIGKNNIQEGNPQVDYSVECDINVDMNTVENIEDNIASSSEFNYSNSSCASDREKEDEEVTHNSSKENEINKFEKEFIRQNKKKTNSCKSRNRVNECINKADLHVEELCVYVSDGCLISERTRSADKDTSHSVCNSLTVTESELIKQNIPYCTLDIMNSTETQQRQSIERFDVDNSPRDQDLVSEVNRSGDPSDDHNKIESEMADNGLYLNCNETDSLGIKMTTEKSNSVDISECEKYSRKSENNRNKHGTELTIDNHGEKEINENVIVDKVNHLINSNCEYEINEKAEMFNYNDVTTIYLRNCEYIKNTDVSCQTQDKKDMSRNELSEDYVKNLIQVSFSGKIELVAENKCEILDIPQGNISLHVSSDTDEDVNSLDNKSIIPKMLTLENSVPQYLINSEYHSDINLSIEKNIQNMSSDNRNESGMAGTTELMKGIELSCTSLQEEICELKKQDSCDYDENFLNNDSNHLTECIYCLQDRNTLSQYEIKTSSCSDVTIHGDRFKCKKHKHNIKYKTSNLSGNPSRLQKNIETDTSLTESMGEEDSPERFWSSDISCHVESDKASNTVTTSSLFPEDNLCQTRGMRQQSFCTSNVMKKKNSSLSCYNKKLVREIAICSSSSNGESSRQFTDSSTAFSVDSYPYYDRQMSDISSLDECSASYEARKRKKLESDGCSVDDSWLGMEPSMDEVNYRMEHCEDNMVSKKHYLDNVKPATNGRESTMKKTCAIN